MNPQNETEGTQIQGNTDKGEKDSKPRIDVDKWLTANKLTSTAKEIKERQLSIAELADMDANNFKDFADSVGLDTLARKRFAKALLLLKPPGALTGTTQIQNIDKNLNGAFGGLGLIQYRPRDDGSSTVVTPQEHEMITQLYERFVRTALLVQNLNGCSQILEFGTRQCKDDINKKTDFVIQQLGERKKVLKEDMLQIRVQKSEKLDQQLQLIRSYQKELEEGKKQFEQAIADVALDVHTRKKKIVEVVNELTGRKDIQLTLVTQPKVRFAFENQMLTTFLSQLNIDDCDQPLPPVIKITRLTYESITIEITCDDEVLVNKATEFAVEVALIHTDSKIKPKKRKLKEKKLKKIKKIKKIKKMRNQKRKNTRTVILKRAKVVVVVVVMMMKRKKIVMKVIKTVMMRTKAAKIVKMKMALKMMKVMPMRMPLRKVKKMKKKINPNVRNPKKKKRRRRK